MNGFKKYPVPHSFTTNLQDFMCSVPTKRNDFYYESQLLVWENGSILFQVWLSHKGILEILNLHFKHNCCKFFHL